MAVEPRIVSLWRNKDKDGFLCSGLLLTGQYILTVRHAFEDWPENRTVYVGLIDGVERKVEADVFQHHREKDAALLKLQTAVSLAEAPALLMDSQRSFDGSQAQLRVIDPDCFQRASLPNYAIGCFDHGTGEYVLNPDSAKGYSGGVVEVDGQIIGLLTRRTKDDPICRALALHLLAPWITNIVAKSAPNSPPPPVVPLPAITSAYLELLARVRNRVCEKLKNPGLEVLVKHWNKDPLEGFVPTAAAAQLQGLFNTLYRATEAGKVEWSRSNPPLLSNIKNDCRFLLSELSKLAVNPASGPAVLRSVADAPPEHLYLTCEYPGTAEMVYCALWDLPHLLSRHNKEIGVMDQGAVLLDDLLPSGQGEDLRQEIIKKLWLMVMAEELPARIDSKLFQQLLARIKRHHERDKRVYLLVAPAPADRSDPTNYQNWARELHLGLTLRTDGQCTHLLMDETELIDSAREYLQLLETI